MEKNIVNEPEVAYIKTLKKTTLASEFKYADFLKMSAKMPFTQTEWSAMLHISERTLQRYAKSNSKFASIIAERAQLLNRLFKEAKTTFGSVDKFYGWLKQQPAMLEGPLSVQHLTSAEGIEKIKTQLGRIQQGIFA
ncbi:MAG: antitoxin Xre-like helix-turn-helix domain-containing protein [Ferruginibacter sp.]